MHCALKELLQQKARCFFLILTIILCTVILTAPTGLFIGLLRSTYSFISDTPQPNIWVMDPNALSVDDCRPLRDSELYRVRGIPGVAWAIPIIKMFAEARLETGDHNICSVIGIDDATLMGAPSVVKGNIQNIRSPDGVIINQKGGKKLHIYHFLGAVFQINNQRAKVVGFCKTSPSYFSYPFIYTTFSHALNYAGTTPTFILLHSQNGENPRVLAKKIQNITGLKALTANQFKKMTMLYYLKKTPALSTFAIAILVACILAMILIAHHFLSFAISHILFLQKNYSNKQIDKILSFEIIFLTFIGWAIGIGITAIFGSIILLNEVPFVLSWWLFCLSALSIFFIAFASTSFCIKLHK